MKRILLNAERLELWDEVFPPEFSDWNGFWYHGTTSRTGQVIEKQGFRPAASGIGVEDCLAVARLFERLNWIGDDLYGSAVLRSFSLKSDLMIERGDPLFLSPYATTASHFATRSYAGGEKTSAIRCVFRELERYLSDPKVRAVHREDPDRWLVSPEEGGLWVADNIDWLAHELQLLGSLRERCMEPWAAYRHGVVYALELKPDFVEEHTERAGMALRVFAPIPPEAIKAKVFLPPWYRPRI